MIFNFKTFLVLVSSLYLAQSVSFDCSFGNLFWIDDGPSYTCFADVEQTEDENTLATVQGDHYEGLNNADVTALGVSFTTFNVIPRNLATFFPNLEVISIHNCTLATITAEDLQPFPNLMFFRAWINRLVSLDGNLFQHNPRLRYIDFDTNAIEIVGQNLLAHLSELNAVDFRRNRCINTYAGTPDAIRALNELLPIRCSDSPGVVFNCTFSESFWGWVGNQVYTCNAMVSGRNHELIDVIGEHFEGRSNADVRALNIQSQFYERVSSNIASFFPDLHVLVIYNCYLLTISAADLEPFPNLQYFRVWRNLIENIEGNLFMHNPNLLYIDFDTNLLEVVGDNLLGSLTLLQAADFSRNPCIDFYAGSPEAIQNLNSLLPIQCPAVPGVIFDCVFDISYWLTPEDYTCNANVTQFGRDHMLIDVIGDHLDGRGNSDVTVLYIRSQVYDQLTRNIAAFFPNLEALLINDCTLMTISAVDLQPFPTLQYFGAWRNLLETLEGNLFMHNPLLRFVDFETNLIEVVGENLLRDLTQLEAVDFSRNPCIDVYAATPEAIQQLNDLLPIRCSDNPGVVFECNFTDTFRGWVNGSVYECSATVFQFGNQTVLRHVLGDHLEDRSNFDVRSLNIENQVYSQISSNIESFFPNLEVLIVYNCNLMTISAADLQPFPSLVYFRVWRNILELIDGNLFMHNPMLAYIDFDSNLIESVGFNLLGNLTHLQTIDFSRNPCVNVYANSPQAIQELNEMLPIMCPGFEDPSFCSAGCTANINRVDDRVSQQAEIITIGIREIDTRFNDLEAENEELRRRITAIEERLNDVCSICLQR